MQLFTASKLYKFFYHPCVILFLYDERCRGFEMIRVLVIEDSLVVQKAIKMCLAKEGEFDVRCENNAKTGLFALSEQLPDVVLLDLYLPDADGLQILREIVGKYRIPVIVMSALFDNKPELVEQVVAEGASGYLSKANPTELGYSVCTKLVQQLHRIVQSERDTPCKSVLYNSDAVRYVGEELKGNDPVVFIGASTGGIPVIQRIICAIHAMYRGAVVIAQHVPIGHIASFAQRLSNKSGRAIKVIQHDMVLHNKAIYLCDGGYVTTVHHNREHYYFSVQRTHSSTLYRPSIDALLSSYADVREACTNVLVVILTGMGKDGVIGSQRLYNKGASILTQDKESSSIYGMPYFVHETGIAKSSSIKHICHTINLMLTEKDQ